MAEARVERRLAAILAADVAGYSRLMGTDEVGTLAALKAHFREVVDPMIAAHHGRIVKTTGDGMLVEFASIVDAVTSAMAVQEEMAERNGNASQRIAFRIGINIGEIIVDGDDIFGDGVNIAARVENECEPGGVCLSGSAFEQVRGKTRFVFDDLGERSLKNIERPVRLFAARSPSSSPATGIEPEPKSARPLALPEKPSIAVLPFQNMSDGSEQEYFADGVVEDIITALSRFKSLFVIARNSSFTYKGRAVDIKQVGRELGVRYVLEGSVRKAASRLRITGQLIDALSGAHIWADRFDGAYDDIFDLQDLVTTRVVGAITPKLEEAEIQRTRHAETDALNAYDLYLRGRANLRNGTRAGNEEALGLFYRTIELDADFASAYGMCAYCYVWRKANGWMKDPPRETEEVMRLVRSAAELGKDDAVALCFGGFALARVVGDLEGGAALLEKALAANPNLATAWGFSGRIKLYLGDHERAIEQLALAMRLSPLDPEIFGVQGATAYAHFFCSRYHEAAVWAERAMQENPGYLPVAAIAAASNALLGAPEKARHAREMLQRIAPELRISNLKDQFHFRRHEDMKLLAVGLQTAGLPE
jgi:adenylate cyclase